MEEPKEPNKDQQQLSAEDEFPDPMATTEEDETQGAVRRYLGGVLALLVVAAIILLLTGLWRKVLWRPVQALFEDWGLPPFVAGIAAGAAILLVFALIIGIAWLGWLKSGMLGHMSVRLRFRRVNAEELPGLDRPAIERVAGEFEALGFVRALDYTFTTEVESPRTPFARLMIHPAHHCYAEVQQLVARGGPPTGVHFNLLSILDDGWSLASGNREPRSIRTIWLWRRPRSLWTAQPGRTPAEVFETHRGLRKRLVDDLGLRVEMHLSPEAYFAFERQAAVSRREALRSKNILVGLIELWFFDRNPPSEWLGEYPRLAKLRLGGWKR
jgi:hypothetical protein